MLPDAREISSPFALQLWPLDRYPFVVMFSSRGCPHDCAFCYTPTASGRRMWYGPFGQMLADVAAVAEAGAKHIFFADPMFVVSRARTLRLLEGLRALQPGVPMSCEMRMEQADGELLRAMSAVGFVKISYGLETANGQVLARVKKPMDLARFRAVVQLTIDHGIAPEVFYMYGLPGESFDDVRRTFDFVASLHPIVNRISEPQQMQLYFGTELLERHERFGIELLGTRPPYLSPGKSYRTSELGPDEFASLEEEWELRRSSDASTGPPAATPAAAQARPGSHDARQYH